MFASRDPKVSLPLVEARYGGPVRPGRTLLFLDEIQAAPEVFAGLRYFHEQLPELHVVAAGSLLDFALAEGGSGVPVGRIEYLNLGPMTFEEFLRAIDRESLVRFMSDYTVGTELPRSIHDELLRLLRLFLVIGGMPASVRAFIATGSHRDSEAERQAILSTFREDFAKYSKLVDRRRLDKLFLKISQLAGKKFKYSHVDRDDRARDLGRGLDLLCMARVAYRPSLVEAKTRIAGTPDRAFRLLSLPLYMIGQLPRLARVHL